MRLPDTLLLCHGGDPSLYHGKPCAIYELLRHCLLYDKNTLLPTYDERRGEPRVKLDNAEEGDRLGCIDCDQCVMVCPTGVDIREGEQIGCITCGLCIDACNSTMDKIN